MAILQVSDFDSGEFSIPQDAFTDIQTYIDKYEGEYLRKLLGAELYLLFIADLTVPTPQVPQTPIYLKIFETFFTDEFGIYLESKGIKAMLINFVYFHYMRDGRARKTKSGIIAPAVELGVDMGYNGYNITESYNWGVNTANIIQYYVTANYSDYPKFNGACFDPIYL